MCLGRGGPCVQSTRKLGSVSVIRRFLQSYRSRVIALSVAALVVNLLLTGVIGGATMMRYAENEQRLTVASMTEGYAASLDRFFGEYDNSLRFVAASAELQRVSAQPAVYEAAVERRFKEFQDSHPEINLMSYGTELGQYYFDDASNHVPAGYDPRVRPWYELGKTLAKGQVGYSSIYADVNTGKDTMTAVTPVFDEQDRLVGVLGVILNLGHLTALNDAQHISGQGYAFVTRDDRYLVHHDSRLNNQPIEQEQYLAVSLAGESKTSTVGEGDETLIVRARYLPSRDMTVWAVASRAEMLGPFRVTAAQSAAIMLVVLVLVVLLVLRFSSTLTREVNNLAGASLEMAKGNLGARADARSSTELQVIAESFNVMAEKIEDQTKALLANILELNNTYRDAIVMLSVAIEANDRYTKGHCIRVEEHSMRLGEQCGLSPERMKVLEYASLIHDVGKIGVPTNILNKEDPLEPTERALIRAHAETGYEILRGSEHLADVAEVVREHHEWFDGSGYPMGLSGEHIFIEARIISIADAFDSMTVARPYRKVPLTTDQAVENLRAGAGTQFDPVLVELFVRLIEQESGGRSALLS